LEQLRVKCMGIGQWHTSADTITFTCHTNAVHRHLITWFEVQKKTITIMHFGRSIVRNRSSFCNYREFDRESG